jgi:hypothetical protein
MTIILLVVSYINRKANRIELQHTAPKLWKQNDTPWNTVLIMLERINETKVALNAAGRKYSEVMIDGDRWIQLEDLIHIVKPFQI